jgi:hypothetical protein
MPILYSRQHLLIGLSEFPSQVAIVNINDPNQFSLVNTLHIDNASPPSVMVKSEDDSILCISDGLKILKYNFSDVANPVLVDTFNIGIVHLFH